MHNFIIDAIVAVCSVMLVWYMVRAYLRKTQKISRADPIAIDNYLQKITQVSGISAYDTFCKSAEVWRVSADRVDQDFKRYLSSQSVPFYVKDFVRKSQKHIDELYIGKGSSFTDKRLWILIQSPFEHPVSCRIHEVSYLCRRHWAATWQCRERR